MIMRTELEVEVEMSGTYVPARRARPLPDGTFEPGDGGFIDGLRVFLAHNGRRLDITALLTPEQLREVEEDGIECVHGSR